MVPGEYGVPAIWSLVAPPYGSENAGGVLQNGEGREGREGREGKGREGKGREGREGAHLSEVGVWLEGIAHQMDIGREAFELALEFLHHRLPLTRLDDSFPL